MCLSQKRFRLLQWCVRHCSGCCRLTANTSLHASILVVLPCQCPAKVSADLSSLGRVLHVRTCDCFGVVSALPREAASQSAGSAICASSTQCAVTVIRV